ncbi:MAG: T9SS type A sorting domain-containing protein [Bacteroidota bacterium]
MKKTTLFIYALLFSMFGFAQEELLNSQNKWILHYMVIEGTTINIPPAPIPIYSPGIIFHGTDPSNYNYSAGVGTMSNTAFDATGPTIINSDTFIAQYPSVTLGACSNCVLEGQYLGAIMGGVTNTPNRVFNYDIVDEGNGMKRLTITTPEGYIAVHGNYTLSVKKFNQKDIVMYPNPVKKKLFFDFKGFPVEKTTVLSMVGATIFEAKVSPQENTIDLSFLKPGVYFVKTTFKDGDATIARFIKE